MRKAAVTLAALAAATLLAVTGCGYKEGPAGTVVAKDDRYSSATKTRHYYLTTTSEFEVSIDDYQACYRGSAYPKCTEVR